MHASGRRRSFETLVPARSRQAIKKAHQAGSAASTPPDHCLMSVRVAAGSQAGGYCAGEPERRQLSTRSEGPGQLPSRRLRHRTPEPSSLQVRPEQFPHNRNLPQLCRPITQSTQIEMAIWRDS